MAKPFKSEFDLMAEAYGTVNRDNQNIISEDTAAKSVRGYFPTAKRALVLKEANMFGDYEEVSSDEPTDETTDEEGTGTVTVQLELDKDTAVKLHTDLMDEVEGEVTSEEPVEGEVADEVAAEDGEDDLPAADHDAPEGGLGSRSMDEAEKVDYGPSGEGKPVHPDEANETEMHSRLDGMVDQNLLKVAQGAIYNVLKDLHADGEEFELNDVAKFIAASLPSEDNQ